MRISALAILMFASTSAFADPLTAPQPDRARATRQWSFADPPGETPPTPEYRDPSHATKLSVIGTVVPLAAMVVGGALLAHYDAPVGAEIGTVVGESAALVFGAFIVGPSWGHVYGEQRMLTTGMKIRLAGLATAGVGGLIWLPTAVTLDGGAHAYYAGLSVIAVGGVLILAGTIHDIATAGDATEAHNKLKLAITPTVIKGASGATAPGMGLSYAF